MVGPILMGPRMRYSNFDVRIRRAGKDYKVHVSSPAGEAHGRFRVPRGLDVRSTGLKPKGHARHLKVTVAEEPPGEVGRRLFDALFSGDVRDRFSVSLHEVKRQRQGLRIRLWLIDVPELAALPWEHLREPNRHQPLALSVHTPIVRYLELAEPPPSLPAEPPLRVLAVRANPSEICRLDLDRESDLLAQSLTRLTKRGRAVVDHLENATLPALEDRLSRGRYHVLHFMGHGDFGEGGGALFFEDEQGRPAPVSFHHLGDLLCDHELRLVVLNACEGARSSQTDPLDGVAQSLVRKGIPAVVGMQLPVSDEVAVHFTSTFYRVLADGQPVEAAITAVRRKIYAGLRSSEWITPVLYMRSEDGQIIKRRPRWPIAAGIALLVASAGVWAYGPQASAPGPPVPQESRGRPCRIATPKPPECPSPRGLDMSFVKIEPGSFLMGQEKGDDTDEPVHQVTISRPFCISRYEVTQEQFTRVLGYNPSLHVAPDLPVHRVSWEAAQEFVAKLNQREQGKPYRLSTEGEWEYAARAGTKTVYSFGDDPDLLPLYGNCRSQGRNDRHDGPAPFGSFQPNPWGLCDMHGNVWEWVADRYGAYPAESVRDPTGPATGNRRVRRGGGWDSSAESCRSAARNSSEPGSRRREIGFRLVREIPLDHQRSISSPRHRGTPPAGLRSATGGVSD